jgi:hypothetical protein
MQRRRSDQFFQTIPDFGKIAPELELLKVPDSRGQVE